MSVQALQVKKGINIEIVSILWMIVEAVVAIRAGILAHSLALKAFGADSVIELVASAILLWRLYVESSGASLERVKQAEKKASWVVGVALLALAGYIVVSAGFDLWTRSSSEKSMLGLALAIASGMIMPYLSRVKKRIGTEIGSKALRADGSCSIVCAYMAWTLIAGLVLTALVGWWWLNALAGLALVYFVVKEGIEAIQEARGVEDACGCGH
ncbi:cation transporter [Ferroacidibacillus organovorans]|uniref:Cation transporter n=1 Tax=Ferroacidibacillus organovorans TaxID=1765683 RepID=A0A124IWF4_9BACL|nr:cation transporter [Ferroacidibacillus organovorans]KUO97235.1 cation transporter [Ferroacidibacillus organovorans]